MVKVKVQKQQLRNTMEKIQNQYNQIMDRASKIQENGINQMCLGWQSPTAKTSIVNLVMVLNEKMVKITKRYEILFEKLNGWAGETVRSGGGNWNNIAFQPNTFSFSAAMAKDGDNGENTVFDDEVVFNGIGKVKKMAKSIIKNQRDTSAIFARRNECFGISNDSPAVFDNFEKKMEGFAKEIETELDACIKNFGSLTTEQNERLKNIMTKYSTDSLPTYSSDGWTKTGAVRSEIGNSNGDNASGSDNNNSESIYSKDAAPGKTIGAPEVPDDVNVADDFANDPYNNVSGNDPYFDA